MGAELGYTLFWTKMSFHNSLKHYSKELRGLSRNSLDDLQSFDLFLDRILQFPTKFNDDAILRVCLLF